MAFTSKEAITVPHDIDTCFSILSNADLFVDFMSLSDITRDVEILKTEDVYLTQDLRVLPKDDPEPSESDEMCTRLYFKLTELVKYVGVAKEIPVIGHITVSKTRRVHVEHREASGGLVITDKIRTFVSAPQQSSPEKTNDDTALDELVVDASAQNPISSQDAREGATTITEDIKGQTSWYLKYFVEMEARRSHQSTMAQYANFLQRHGNR